MMPAAADSTAVQGFVLPTQLRVGVTRPLGGCWGAAGTRGGCASYACFFIEQLLERWTHVAHRVVGSQLSRHNSRKWPGFLHETRGSREGASCGLGQSPLFPSGVVGSSLTKCAPSE